MSRPWYIGILRVGRLCLWWGLHLLDMPLQDLTKHHLDLLLAINGEANNNKIRFCADEPEDCLMISQAQTTPTSLLQ